MRVSVALATHNGVGFLSEQLESVLGQSRVPDQIVVSDDASTDGTVALVEVVLRSRSAAPHLVLVENPTALGVTANFERALRSCDGDIVFLCDQDDVWHPDRIAAAIAVFEADPVATLVACDARLVDSGGHPLGDTLFGALRLTERERRALHGDGTISALMRRNLVTGATTAVRRDLVTRAAPFPSAWVHDEWLAVVAAVGSGIRMIPTPLVDYRQHDGNEIGVRRPRLRDKLARIAAERAARNARLMRRAEALSARFGTPHPGLEPKIVDLVRSKLAHERVRSALPPHRLGRVVPILREVSTGRYHSSGLGMQDVIRDLIQPAGEQTSS